MNVIVETLMNDVYCLTLMIHHFGVTKKNQHTPLFFHYFADIRHHSGLLATFSEGVCACFCVLYVLSA